MTNIFLVFSSTFLRFFWFEQKIANNSIFINKIFIKESQQELVVESKCLRLFRDWLLIAWVGCIHKSVNR